MRNAGSHLISLLTPLLLLVVSQIQAEESGISPKDGAYATRVQECVELLMEHGTDKYGEIHAPILVSILDVESRICPKNPKKLDEPWRVARRGRRNPAGANLLSDNTLLRTMILLSSVTGKNKYADFARKYMGYYMKNLVDKKGFFWWGWHRHYDVYKDEPRGHLDLWEPYNAGYQYAIYTAQAYVYAYDVCKEPLFLTTAERFAEWIKKTPPGTTETKNTWYQGYSDSFGRKGTYAGKYGRTVSFYVHLYIVTKDQKYLGLARQMADDAIRKLYHKGLFRGHPAKPYYEAMDGVGYLLYALLELDQVVKDSRAVLAKRAIVVGKGKQKTTMGLDNW